MMIRTNKKAQTGLTLLEVIVAVSIMAVIAVVSFQALSVVSDSSEISQEKLKRLKRIDRMWIILENDVRNILAVSKQSSAGVVAEAIPPLQVGGTNQDYWLMLLRGGVANPLGALRTEVKRVAYKLDEDIIYRYSWIDAYNLDEENAVPQKLLDGVEEILVRVLTPQARSLEAGPWEDTWPATRDNTSVTLPMALEVTLTLKDAGDLRRIMTFVEGVPAQGATGNNIETDERSGDVDTGDGG